MDLNTFISNFEKELEVPSKTPLKKDTSFRELDVWNSMQALITIAMVDEQYDVTLTADDLKQCNTLGELFELVKQKKEG